MDFRSFILLFFLSLCSYSSSAQLIQVLDAENQEALEGVTFLSNEPKAFAVTNLYGKADLSNFKDAKLIEIRSMTKEDGQFKYNIRENEDDIVFKTQEINAEGAFIYILDEENNKRDRMIIGKDLASVKEKDVKKDQKIVGGMELNGEPYSNGEVAVYDINNYKLGTATTDEKGVFAFETAMDEDLKQIVLLSSPHCAKHHIFSLVSSF